MKQNFTYTENIPVSFNKKPHVFIILKESLNTGMVESKTPDGREYTPYYNKLIKKGLYIEKYYGNAIRTCNGTFSFLSSLAPSIVGKVSYDYAELNFLSITSVFQNNGYQTIYFQAYDNIRFDNIDQSILKKGFLENMPLPLI